MKLATSERGVAAIAAVLVILLWIGAAWALGGCQSAPPTELRSASVRGYVLIESGGTMTRVDLGTGLALNDADVPTRLVAAALYVDADIGSAQVGVDVERADGGPHVVVIRWGALHWRFQVGGAD